MAKLDVSKILVKGASLESKRLDITKKNVSNIINETKQKQKDILNLRFMDQEKLKMVIQL